MKRYSLIQDYVGYLNKKDITNCDPRALVAPSQNVIINDSDKVEIRAGTELYTTADTSGVGIRNSFDWTTNTNTERTIISTNDGKVKFLNGTSYIDLMTGITVGNDVNFTTWWSTTENKDLLLFVKGDATINMWSGAVTTLASVTANTITKEGVETWAESRFLVAGTRQVVIDGVTYTYTGGEGTTTLTGVTGDPTAGGHAVGAVIHQAVRVTSNSPYAGAANLSIDCLNNYVYVGGINTRAVYMSKSTDYTSFTFTANRLPSEGALFYLDSNFKAFVNSDDGNEYISGTNDDWYQILFTLSSDNSKEAVTIKRLKSGPGQGALSQGAVGNVKNAILYINSELAVDELGRVENINTPQSKPLSDAVAFEFENADYTISPHIKYWRNKTYIALPSDSKVMIYDHEKGYWFPPQILAISRFAIIDGELYGHSKDNIETYKLFTGTSDNGLPIAAKAAFSYRNFGRPDWKKSFDEYFTEGYISSNTKLTLGIKYDFGGFKGVTEKTIDGSDAKITYQTASDGSLGKNPLGKNPLGSITDSIDDLPKFRDIKPLVRKDFYEVQTIYETNDVDYRWQILRHGPNVLESNAEGVEIKN
jgi:hypothetical protein